jgi:hypothetical protein
MKPREYFDKENVTGSTILEEEEVDLRPTVGQSVLVSGAHLGPVTNFSFAMKFPVDSCSFGIL